MNWERLWAGVELSSEGGRCETLLQTAAQQGIRLRNMRPTAYGFSAVCPAWQYRQLASLARRYRVRMRIKRRIGLYFALRSMLCRGGVWTGFLVFGLLVWQLQRVVWFIDCSDLSVGQAARVQQAMSAVGLEPGAVVTQQLLTEAEYAIMALNGEFSWASVNFEKGRVTVECAQAKPIPDIDSETISPLVAKADGVILSVEPEDGTPQVAVGQHVTQGQMLIGVARAERDGSMNYRRAAGRVIAEVEWSGSAQVELQPRQTMLMGQSEEWYILSFAGHSWSLGQPEQPSQELQALLRTRHSQLSILGLPLPVAVTTCTAFLCEEQILLRSESLAAALARLSCEQQLREQFPDAEIFAWQEQVEISDGILTLSVTAHLRADLCIRPD